MIKPVLDWTTFDHDNHIQERIILQLNYEKYKDLIEKEFINDK